MESFHQNVENFSFILAMLVFLAYIVVDGMWAYYTLAVTKRKPFRAATTGALMYFILGFGVLSYVNNYLYLIPLVLGSWIGTYIVVSHDGNNSIFRIKE